MKIYDANTDIDFDGCVIALGNFDGIHSAHKQILESCRAHAEKLGVKCGVLMFDRHSVKTTHTREIELITTQGQKLELMKAAGMDFVYMRPFDDEFMKKQPEEFVCMLLHRLNVKAVCVGYDYRFGHKAAGDTKLLEQLGEKYGFDVFITPQIQIDGETVSSTLIRALVKNGEVEKAAQFLSRPFFIEGEVVRGKQNGRKMGFPTANAGYFDDTLLPKTGVYAGITTVEGQKYGSVINVGKNPTFNGDVLTVESHILDFDRDIYGQIVKIEFLKYLRGDVRFSSVDELREQIAKDAEQARGIGGKYI